MLSGKCSSPRVRATIGTGHGRMRSAMISLDRMVGSFPHTPVEWIELVIVAVLLWLLMVVVISEIELSSISPI
jgi:hypothetical protein